MHIIPLFRPEYGPEEEAAVASVLRSRWTGLGPRVEEFEEKFAAMCGASFAIAVNSCTAALELAFRWMAFASKIEATIPAITFCSTAQAAQHAGLSPRFVDVKETNLVRRVAGEAFGSTCHAIVHYAGAHWEEDGPSIIHDAAHCSPLEFTQPAAGIVCWSFEAKKIISCGDGGMITTNSAAQAQAFRKWRWCGISRSTWEREKNTGYQWDYDIPDIGRKCHMNDITAAIGLQQLAKISEMQLARYMICRRYSDAFAGKLWTLPFDNSSGCHLFVIQVSNRNDLFEKLRLEGITTGVHYKPLYEHTSMRFFSRNAMANTEFVAPRILSLPVYPSLSSMDQDFVIDRVLRYAVP